MRVFVCKSKFSRMMNIEQCLISAISSKIDDAISYLNLAMYNMQQHFCFPFISAPSIQFIFLSCYELYELWVIISHGALLHLLGIHIYCWLWIPLNMGCSWEQNEKLSVKFTRGKNIWGCPFRYQMNLYIYMCSRENNELLNVSHGIIMHLFVMIRF